MPQLPAATRVGDVHLQVADLERSLVFYRDLLGLRVLRETGAQAWLSATGGPPELLRLTARLDATGRPRRATGLFHVAWRAPDRRELGRWLHRLVETGYPLQGASDHAVSEALYLADPDGLGVELHCDRPRDNWPRRGRYVAMVSEPLDTGDLLAQADGSGSWDGAHPDTDIGHVHLCVSSLEQAEAFYVDALGMDVMQRDVPGALFLAAGGYHHHLGTNTWQSAGASAPPEEAVGLLSYSLTVPGTADVAAVRERVVGTGWSVAHGSGAGITTRDGDGIALRVTTEAG